MKALCLIMALIIIVSIVLPCYAGTKILCFDKRTGKPVNEFQSDAAPGTLKKNAVVARLGTEADFEEREVSETEWQSWYDALVATPMKQQRDATLVKKNSAAQAIRNAQDFPQLKQAIIDYLGL